MTNTRATDPNRPALRRALAIGGGLLGVAALAGCAPAAGGGDASTAPSSAAASATPSASASSSTPSASSSGLKDGSYTATGDYVSPGGPAQVKVTVGLKDGAVSAVTVTPEAQNPTSRQYESQFASGIAAVAVGKPIADLQVGAVSGSSLTSQGFEKALAAIRKQAAA